MPLPNLLVIGAAKCGTTSLHHYLGLHPEIEVAPGSDSNEIKFFSDDARWRRGPEWYARQFRDAPVRVDVSPAYSQFPYKPSAPERIAGLLADVRFVYLVRDPIERIASDWHQARAARTEVRDFDQALTPLEDSRYVIRSRYATQLERYLAHFPEERILVVDQRDLLDDRVATMRRIFGFAGVDESFVSAGFAGERNVTAAARPLSPAGRRVMRAMHRTIGHRLTHALAERVPRRLPVLERRRGDQLPVIDGELRERLVAVLAPEVERLRALTGQRFPTWSL